MILLQRIGCILMLHAAFVTPSGIDGLALFVRLIHLPDPFINHLGRFVYKTPQSAEKKVFDFLRSS